MDFRKFLRNFMLLTFLSICAVGISYLKFNPIKLNVGEINRPINLNAVLQFTVSVGILIGFLKLAQSVRKSSIF
jgi:hypothetical protein